MYTNCRNVIALDKERSNEGSGLDGIDENLQPTVDRVEGEEQRNGDNRASSLRFKGPMHEIIYMAKEGKLIDLYFKDDENVVYEFVTKVLAYVFSKRQWNLLSVEMKYDEFVTNSDEAFALLLVENNCYKWEDVFLNPDLPKDRRVKTQWTECNGDKKWSIEGMMRYKQLYEKLEEYKEAKREQYDKMVVRIKEKEIENDSRIRSRKKKKKNGMVYGGDGLIEIDGNCGDSQNMEDLENFLM